MEEAQKQVNDNIQTKYNPHMLPNIYRVTMPHQLPTDTLVFEFIYHKLYDLPMEKNALKSYHLNNLKKKSQQIKLNT